MDGRAAEIGVTTVDWSNIVPCRWRATNNQRPVYNLLVTHSARVQGLVTCAVGRTLEGKPRVGKGPTLHAIESATIVHVPVSRATTNRNGSAPSGNLVHIQLFAHDQGEGDDPYGNPEEQQPQPMPQPREFLLQEQDRRILDVGKQWLDAEPLRSGRAVGPSNNGDNGAPDGIWYPFPPLPRAGVLDESGSRRRAVGLEGFDEGYFGKWCVGMVGRNEYGCAVGNVRSAGATAGTATAGAVV